MTTFFNLLAFAGLTYLGAYYMFNRDYEFAMLADRYVGFGERLGNSVNKMSGNRIKRDIGWVLFGLMTLAYLIIAILGISWLVNWLPNPVLLWVFPLLSGCTLFIRDLKPMRKRDTYKILYVLIAVLVGGLVSGWYLLPTWWTYNVVAFIVGLMSIKVLSPMRLRYLLGIMIAVVAYDIWGVFISGKIVDIVTTTIEVSRYIPPAVVFTPNSTTILGVADIIFPGLVIVSVFEYELAIPTFVGFGVGLGLVLLTLSATGRPLPAMLFLGPTTFIGMRIGAWVKGISLEW